MPYIAITVAALPDPALAQRIAVEISALTSHHLRKDPSITAISVSFQDPGLWFVGGASLVAQGKTSFWLDIKVVDGTNIKAELAGYLDAVFSAMGAALGDLHPESYVLVHEVPAAAYGYGGVTQEHRFIAGRLGL